MRVLAAVVGLAVVAASLAESKVPFFINFILINKVDL